MYSYSQYSYFCKVRSNVSTFIYDFSYVHFFSFFPLSLGLNISQFWYLFKEPAFNIIDFIVFLFSLSFISALIFIVSIFLLTLGSVCSSFSSSSRYKVRLLIYFFCIPYFLACCISVFIHLKVFPNSYGLFFDTQVA